MCATLPTLLSLAALAVSASAPGPRLVVTPAILEVVALQPWADVVVRNDGDGERLVRTAVLAWSQDETGAMVLGASEDAFAFPGRAALRAGESRRFRVSVTRPSSERERTYRLALDVASPLGDELRVLVPVFVAPAVDAVQVALRVGCTGARACRVVLENSGTVRVRPSHVAFLAIAADGRQVVLEVEAWWVLAGGRRVFDLEVPELPPGAPVVALAEVDGRTLRAEARARDAPRRLGEGLAIELAAR